MPPPWARGPALPPPAAVLCAALLLLGCARAKIGYFWHVTDLHLDDQYMEGGDPSRGCHAAQGRPTRTAGRYGDLECDAPWPLVESAVSAMRNKHGEVEFVLWTGDAVSRAASPSEEFKLLRNLTELLSRAFKAQFVFPALGHRDPGPTPRHAYGDLSRLWRQWLPSDAISTFDRGGYYLFEPKPGRLRLVMLNTNLMVEGADDDAARLQWEWLERTLLKSQHSQAQVYLVGHVPPGVDERRPAPSPGAVPPPRQRFSPSANRRYLDLVSRHAPVIAGQFFGHLHSDSFRVFYNGEGRPVSWALVAPAVTPRRVHHSGANNPGLRLYKFDTDSGRVLDYAQYFLDLAAANERGQPEWALEYNFTAYYGQSEVSAGALHRLASSFSHPSETQFQKYHHANSARLHSSCDEGCQLKHFCALTRLDYAEFHSCVASAASALASANLATRRRPALPPLPLAAALLLAPLLLILRPAPAPAPATALVSAS